MPRNANPSTSLTKRIDEAKNLSNTIEQNPVGEEGFKKPTPKPGLQGDCVKMIAGCTDSKAQNYIPNAEFDDGSCTYKLELCSELNWFEKILKFFKLKECRD